MCDENKGPVMDLCLEVDACTLDKVRHVVELVGFSSVEDFVSVAVKKEVDRYRVLMGYVGTGEKMNT